ncbi:MAG: hypothetical protein GX137_05610 [Thermoplasmatales archaeon]|jgi:hypothetical protein|nr:hypothetical protein [Thermoplasmatales archaeon]
MSECKTTVDAGVCRFKTVIEAVGDDMMNVTFKIRSECSAVRAMAKGLEGPIGIFDVLKLPFSENPVYCVANGTIIHSSCPVPSAVIKSAEVAADMALKKDVSMKME